MNSITRLSIIIFLVSCAALHAEERTPPPLPYFMLASPHAAEFPIAATRDTTTPKKSKLLGAFYSAVIPGMGELYAGNYDAGRIFSVSEVLLWLGYAGMTLFGNAMITDASTFATAHSGAQTAGKADQFLTDIGNFLNTGTYNDKKARDGSYSLIYTTSDYNWQWDNDANRNIFRSMHLRANTLIDNTKYLVAAIVVNHMASAIDAVLQVNKFNRGITVGATPTFDNGSWGSKVEMKFFF